MNAMPHSNLMKLFLISLSMHVLLAFDVEDCPGECHCTMDGTMMLVDCSSLGLTEFPNFPDNQVRYLNFKFPRL